jgi:hypothetical protein
MRNEGDHAPGVPTRCGFTPAVSLTPTPRLGTRLPLPCRHSADQRLGTGRHRVDPDRSDPITLPRICSRGDTTWEALGGCSSLSKSGVVNSHRGFESHPLRH